MVDFTDILDGRAITGLQFASTGLSGDLVAFQATFADGSQGIYTAAVVPEPCSLALLGMAGLLLAGARRGRPPRRALGQTAF